MAIMVLVLTLPFFSHRVEKQLELFLFLTGRSVRDHLRRVEPAPGAEALLDPIKITLAVLIAGLLFRLIRPKIGGWTNRLARRVGFAPLFFVVVVGLGLLSSFITAIIAALILAEVISALRLPRTVELRLVIIACFSIGLGAVLTPLGEPLSTIAVSKLSGEPHHAGFLLSPGTAGQMGDSPGLRAGAVGDAAAEQARSEKVRPSPRTSPSKSGIS